MGRASRRKKERRFLRCLEQRVRDNVFSELDLYTKQILHGLGVPKEFISGARNSPSLRDQAKKMLYGLLYGQLYGASPLPAAMASAIAAGTPKRKTASPSMGAKATGLLNTYHPAGTRSGRFSSKPNVSNLPKKQQQRQRQAANWQVQTTGGDTLWVSMDDLKRPMPWEYGAGTHYVCGRCPWAITHCLRGKYPFVCGHCRYVQVNADDNGDMFPETQRVTAACPIFQNNECKCAHCRDTKKAFVVAVYVKDQKAPTGRRLHKRLSKRRYTEAGGIMQFARGGKTRGDLHSKAGQRWNRKRKQGSYYPHP
jgi:hypothetical protein